MGEEDREKERGKKKKGVEHVWKLVSSEETVFNALKSLEEPIWEEK